MAISFVNPALGGTADTTSFSVTLPATQAGDIIILEYTHRGTTDATLGGTYSGPAFSEKHDQQYATSTFSGKTLWSRATGNHSGQTVTGSGLTNSCAAVVTVYRGAKASGDPLAAATIVGEQNASANETQAQITTLVNGAWVVLVVANSPDVAVTSQSCTSPGALTSRAERLSTGGTDTSISHASALKASAGATGAFTWAQTDGASGSWAYAIQPEPDVVPNTDGDDYWSGAQEKSGALLAAKRVAAGIVVAAGICQGLQWQTDENPSPPVIHGHDKVEIVAVGKPLPLIAFAFDELIVPQPAAPTIVEESEYHAQRAPPRPPPQQPWHDDLFEPVTPDDEYHWTPLVARSAPIAAAWSVPDELPIVVPMEDWFSWHQPPLVKPRVSQWHSEDEVPTEEAAPFVPDEDYWLDLSSRRVTVQIVNWPVTGGSGSPAAAPTEIADDYHWQPPQPAIRRPINQVWRVEDEIPTPVFGHGPIAQPGQRIAGRPLAMRLFVEDDFPQQAPAVDIWDEAVWLDLTRKQRAPLVTVWTVEDEPPAPSYYDEQSWVADAPAQRAPQPLYLPDPDVTPELSAPPEPLPGKRKGHVKRPRHIDPAYFERAKRELEAYYAQLDAAAQPSSSASAPPPPRPHPLTEDMVSVASIEQLSKIATAAAEAKDRELAKQEQKRRRAAAVVMMMMSF